MNSLPNIDNAATIPAEYKNLGGLDRLPTSQEPLNPDSLDEISPLGLSIHLDSSCGDDLLDLLFKEMDYYSDLLGNRRRTQQIWLQGAGLKSLTPAELTQLSYRVGTQFQVNNGNGSEYGIEICHTQITPENMALLRGLGFRQLRIHFGSNLNLSEGDWIDEVANNIELLSNFDFEEVYCRVHLGDFPQQSDIKKLLLSLQLYRPQQIELAGTPNHNPSVPVEFSHDSRMFYMGLMEFLTNRGYHALGNHLFVSEESRLNQLRKERSLAFTPWGFCSSKLTGWIGLGPGATGHIEGQHYRNTSSMEEYRARVSEGAPPYTHNGLLLENRLGLNDIVQSLFCYGELDGRLVEALPTSLRFAVESTITEAGERLWLTPAGYLWRLTDSGMIHLRELFNLLVGCRETSEECVTE